MFTFGYRFTVDLGDRGNLEIGVDTKVRLAPGASETECKLVFYQLERVAGENAAKQAKTLLVDLESETPRDPSIPGSTFQVLRSIIENGGLDPDSPLAPEERASGEG